MSSTDFIAIDLLSADFRMELLRSLTIARDDPFTRQIAHLLSKNEWEAVLAMKTPTGRTKELLNLLLLRMDKKTFATFLTALLSDPRLRDMKDRMSRAYERRGGSFSGPWLDDITVLHK